MKVVITAIAIGVGLLVFDQKPVKDAQAENAVLVGGNYMLLQNEGYSGVWHMYGRQLRYCDMSSRCKAWE